MASIINYPCYLGQKLKSIHNSPLELVRFLGLTHLPIYNVFYPEKNLFYNLKKLYLQNQNIQGRRINIGGDHSMAIASVASSLYRYPNSKVIWVDAHPDINTRNSSPTQNYHGMPLGFLSHLDKNIEFDFEIPKLELENLIYLGIRDIDPYEKSILDSHKIPYFSVAECENNLSQVLLKLESFIGNHPIHISFDVDSLDPKVLDSTGTPVPEGLSLETAKLLLNFLNTQDWVSLDITELNVSLGNSQKSMTNLKYIFSEITNSLQYTRMKSQL